MQSEHYKKNRTIAELFLEDKEAMFKLPEKEFEVYKLKKAKAYNYGKVKFDNHIYSTSPEYAKKQVWIKADAFNIVILDQDYREIKTAAFIDKKNLILYGPVGTGKTHLATAIGVEACNREKS